MNNILNVSIHVYIINLNAMRIHYSTQTIHIHTNQNTDSNEIEFLFADSLSIYHFATHVPFENSKPLIYNENNIGIFLKTIITFHQICCKLTK